MQSTAKIIIFSSLLLAISLGFHITHAQSSIHGNIITGTNNQPLPNANVLLLKAKDSSLVKGVITGATGEYRFESITAGRYLIASSYTGPTFNQLAPSLFFFDLNSYAQGNPGLQPAFSNALTTDYTYRRFMFSLSYSHVKNAIAPTSTKVYPADNKQVYTGENLKSMSTASATILLPFTINSWWNMQNNVLAAWQQAKTTYNARSVEFQIFNYRITTSQNFKLPKEYAIELTGFYQSPSLRGRSKFLAYGALNLGVQKKLAGKKGSLRFTVTDIFHSLSIRFNDYIPDQNLNAKVRLDFVQRTFSLTYAFGFGNDKLKAKRSSTGAEDERKRVE